MGIAYPADRDSGCTVFVWRGPVTFQHTIDHVLQLAADPHWPPGLLQRDGPSDRDERHAARPRVTGIALGGQRVRAKVGL